MLHTVGRIAPTWGNVPRHRPTYSDMGQVGPFVTRSAVSQTVNYVTIALPFLNIINHELFL